MTQNVEERAEQEIQEFKDDYRQYTKGGDNKVLCILHLSDIHLGDEIEANKYRMQLETDLKHELKINKLEYLVISGDIGNYSTKDEYKAAFVFIDKLIKHFGLDSNRVIIVPGNHDLNWDLAEKAYNFVSSRKLSEPLPEGRFIPAGKPGVLLRDEEAYRKRFVNFNEYLYSKVHRGQIYPYEYAEQGILHLNPHDRILFLALNSCWEIDHHYTNRYSINMEALVHAFDQLTNGNYDNWLKIAVWHHPVSGREMMNDDFLQLLSVHNFQICMHGHIHEAQEGFYKYDSNRGLHIIGAGTFGAPVKEQMPGIPLQYNLLKFDPEEGTITVETRKKEKSDGAWSADARWGDKNNPVPRYTIQLKPTTIEVDSSYPGIREKTKRAGKYSEERISNVIHIYGSDVTIGNSKKEIKNMSKTIKFGNGATVSGNVVIADKIKESFNNVDSSNAPDELKKLLKELATAVDSMCKELPEEKAEQVTDDLQALTKEATKEKPREKWWELSVEGIKEASESVGEIGKTSLVILKELIPFLEELS